LLRLGTSSTLIFSSNRSPALGQIYQSVTYLAAGIGSELNQSHTD